LGRVVVLNKTRPRAEGSASGRVKGLMSLVQTMVQFTAHFYRLTPSRLALGSGDLLLLLTDELTFSLHNNNTDLLQFIKCWTGNSSSRCETLTDSETGALLRHSMRQVETNNMNHTN